MCHNDELGWLFTNRFRATRYMKVKRMGTTEILRRICLFSANKIQNSESQTFNSNIIDLNSSLWHKIVTKLTKKSRYAAIPLSRKVVENNEVLCQPFVCPLPLSLCVPQWQEKRERMVFCYQNCSYLL